MNEMNNKEKTLVIGFGEIGKSLSAVLAPTYEIYFVDDKIATAWFSFDEYTATKTRNGEFRVMNVCIPYSERYVDIVCEYAKIHKPKLIIIHSTVRPGTTRLINKKLGKVIAVNSPVNGRHPHLDNAIKTFTKFIGSQTPYKAFEAVEYLQKANITTHVFYSPETTELAKVLCTTQYGWHIVLMKEIARICEEYNVPFHEVYTEWNAAYNQGYAKLNEHRFLRPALFPLEGAIGGHCVVPNCDLLPDFVTELVKSRNKKYKHENRKKH